MQMSKIDLMIAYAFEFVGTMYRWGGSSPMEGFDCSGFCQELLMSIGIDPRGDQTAQGLYNFLSKHYPKGIDRGSVLFFGEATDKITHIAVAVDDDHMIEAGGGNSSTTNAQKAIIQQAFVRVRPIKNRSDLVAAIKLA